MTTDSAITVNDRHYPALKATVVAICLDGCEPAYFDEAIAAGVMPNLKRIRQTGTAELANCVIPSFTNPNNLSIATGHPPSVHGICGNYLIDPDSGEEVMMNDVRFLRAPTLFKGFYDAGARVALVTAKDKLRALLGAGLLFDQDRALCFSAERSGETTVAEHGIDNASKWLGMPVPDVYSAELSEFVFAAGVKLLAEWKPDVMYLTTTDYVQHKHAPGAEKANDFYEMFDKYLGQLDAMGAVIAITADHGMQAKHGNDGRPNVVYMQGVLDKWLGEGATRVILPITDPYVVHHGALGSYATVYLQEDTDRQALCERLKGVDGIETVLTREEAAERYELPPDRIGDIVLTSDKNVTIGTSESRHDLAALKEPLRSHGGLHEQSVPFVMNRAVDLDKTSNLRNFDAFYYAAAAAAN